MIRAVALLAVVVSPVVAVAAPASTPTAVTRDDQLVGTWNAAHEDADVIDVTFAISPAGKTFKLTHADHTSQDGRFFVEDGLILLWPTNPAATTWCGAGATLSTDKLELQKIDKTRCAKKVLAMDHRKATATPLYGTFAK